MYKKWHCRFTAILTEKFIHITKNTTKLFKSSIQLINALSYYMSKTILDRSKLLWKVKLCSKILSNIIWTLSKQFGCVKNCLDESKLVWTYLLWNTQTKNIFLLLNFTFSTKSKKFGPVQNNLDQSKIILDLAMGGEGIIFHFSFFGSIFEAVLVGLDTSDLRFESGPKLIQQSNIYQLGRLQVVPISVFFNLLGCVAQQI